MKNIFLKIIKTISITFVCFLIFLSWEIWMWYQLAPEIQLDKNIQIDKNLYTIDNLDYTDKCQSAEHSIYILLGNYYWNWKYITKNYHINMIFWSIKNSLWYLWITPIEYIYLFISEAQTYWNQNLCKENYIYLKQQQLNDLFYGNNIYWYKQAAKFYFNNDINNLELCESIWLAISIPRAPSLVTYWWKIWLYGKTNIYSNLKRIKENNLITEEYFNKQIQICKLSSAIVYEKTSGINDNIKQYIIDNMLQKI